MNIKNLIASISILLLLCFPIKGYTFSASNLAGNGGSAAPSGPAGGDLSGIYPNPGVSKVNGNTPGGSCTNQAVISLNSSAVPTCATLTSAYVNNTIALTGTDINTSNQVTATHLASALPTNQGGTGTAANIVGVVKGGSPMTAAIAGTDYQSPLTADVPGGYLDPANGLSGLVVAATQSTARSNLGLGTAAIANAPVGGGVTGTIWVPLENTANDTLATLAGASYNATVIQTTDVFPTWHNYNGVMTGNLSSIILPTNGGIYNNYIAFHLVQASSGGPYTFTTPTTSAAGGVVGPGCGQVGTAAGSKFDIAYYWDPADSSWNSKCTLIGVAFVDTPTISGETSPNAACTTTLVNTGCTNAGLTGCTEINRMVLPAHSGSNYCGSLVITPATSTTMPDAENLNVIVTYNGVEAPTAITWTAGSSGVLLRTGQFGASSTTGFGTSPLCLISNVSGQSRYVAQYNAVNSKLTETGCTTNPPALTLPGSLIGPNPFWAMNLGTGAEGPEDCNGNLSGTHYYTTFTVQVGETCNNNIGNQPLIIYATGACNIQGTINADGGHGGSSLLGVGGGSSGGSGGGTAAGAAGSNSGFNATALQFAAGGTAGASSNGAGGNATALTTAAETMAHNFGYMFAGAHGAVGGSSGGSGGLGGTAIWLVCNSINFTGTLNVSGANGGNCPSNNAGSGSGGAGGVIVEAAYSYVADSGTKNVAAGLAGTAASFTCGLGGTSDNGWVDKITLQ